MDANKVVNKLFDLLISRYEGNFETSVSGSEFIFDLAHMMYYKCH